VIGVLAWEGGGERSLSQLEGLPGNILHPETFGFPVRVARVRGANYRTVVEQPNRDVLARMIAAAREMSDSGIRAVTTSCGFNVIFQQELADAVAVPVFTSSLVQVPLVSRMLGQGRAIGILTADRRSLTLDHLKGAGIPSTIPVCIAGVEDAAEFSKVRRDAAADLDPGKFIREVVDVAGSLSHENGEIGAIVLECTDLVPAAAAIRESLGVPVFDIVTLTNMVHAAFTGPGSAPP